MGKIFENPCGVVFRELMWIGESVVIASAIPISHAINIRLGIDLSLDLLLGLQQAVTRAPLDTRRHSATHIALILQFEAERNEGEAHEEDWDDEED